MNKQAMTAAISAAKENSGLTWEQIAAGINMSPCLDHLGLSRHEQHAGRQGAGIV